MTGGEYAGERLIFNANPGEGFVVFQHHIIPRLVFFYKIVFQQECIQFCIHHNMPDLGNLANQDPKFTVLVCFFIEIGGNPFFQVLCFSDV